MDQNQQDNETQVVETTLKKVSDYARAAHKPQDFLANLKELIFCGLGKSPALFTIVKQITKSHIQELPNDAIGKISTSLDLLITWNLFKSMSEENRLKLINKVLNKRRFELFTQLILTDGKEMKPLFPSGSSLHDQMTVLVPEFIKLNENKLNRKKVVAFFADIGIDFRKTDNKELFNAAVTVNSPSLVELWLTIDIQRSSHLTTLTPLTHYAASLPDGQKLLDVLYKYDYSPNAQDPKTMSTVLMIYCSDPNNSIEAIQNLVLERNVDLNLSNKFDATALTCACINGFWKAALFLLDQEKLSLSFPPYTVPKGKTQYEKTLDAIEKRLVDLYPKKYEKKKVKIEEYKKITEPDQQLENLKSLIKSCSKLDSQAR